MGAGVPRPLVANRPKHSMSAAAPITTIGARHEQAAVGRRLDGLIERLPEAWPAGATFEFGIGRKERLTAARALEHALTLFVVERAGSWPLGSVLPENLKLLRR